MEPRSNTLFHFTKSEEVLFKIFLEGFWPRYSLEDTSWIGSTSHKYVAYPMVCFCDIPLARISEHVRYYGSYGIGLSKTCVEKNNLSPVLYLTPNSYLCKSIVKSLYSAVDKSDEKDKNESKKNVKYILSHIKPTRGNMVVNGEIVEKEFYQESEWRYVPLDDRICTHISEGNYSNKIDLEIMHLETKEHTSLKFSPNDVSFVFVPKDADIPNVINFMQSQLDHYPSADLKVLYSRVISIETINRNI